MNTYAIELTTRDGAQFNFDCPDDQNLLAAAAAAHINLPSQCRQGSCGACYAEISQGEYHLGPHSPSALPSDAAHKKGTLLCCTQAKSDLSIYLPYDQRHIRTKDIPQRNAEIVAIETIGLNTLRMELILQPDENGGNTAEFEPGQFMELEVPDQGVKRAYSIANTSNWEGRLEFLIRIQPKGAFSTWLKEKAAPGQTIAVHGPQGSFGLKESGLRPRWFVAGGTGLAPMLSMLRRMAEFQEPHPAKLYFGVNSCEEIFCQDELKELQAQLPKLQVTLCVWKPQADWQGFIGTPIDALSLDLASAESLPDIYFCGPPALIDAGEKAARAKGLSDDQIISERFA